MTDIAITITVVAVWLYCVGLLYIWDDVRPDSWSSWFGVIFWPLAVAFNMTLRGFERK